MPGATVKIEILFVSEFREADSCNTIISKSLNLSHSLKMSLFIIIPKGTDIRQSELEREIDDLDYGEIDSVSMQKTKSGDRHAIVRFRRWFRSSSDVLERLKRGVSMDLQTRNFGSFRMSIYKETVSLSQKVRRERSRVMTCESEIPKEIRRFIQTGKVGNKPPTQQYVYVDVVVDRDTLSVPIAPCLSLYLEAPQVPLAPGLSFPKKDADGDDIMSLEDGEIQEA